MSKSTYLKKLNFVPKNNAEGIFYKKYSNVGNYCVEVDIERKKFDFGNKIRLESKTTQNFSQEENWVVFECVNRLLEKGYKPENIILEKVYPTGHGTSGRLDVLVMKNKKAFLMIECKTWGQEFDKAFKKLQKDGGQLFTYFQQDKNSEFLVLYTSQFDEKNNRIKYTNGIVKIEPIYKDSANVKEFYALWDKKIEHNGIFESEVLPYIGKSTAILNFMGGGGLKDISPEDSGPIFNQFLEILRHNVVSDKPNAFNKIFNLFLCKIIDEAKTLPNQPLKFQWFSTPQIIEERNSETGEIEKNHYPADDNVTFQKRLTELYTLGMREFLKKEVQAFGEEKIRNLLGEKIDKKMADELIYNMVADFLKKNNEFAIKEVFDTDTFEENSVVVKEIVDLLSRYRIRYPRKQQHLSDFFEKLLTTGLKQESGQFFTPVPVARFICKSIPLKKIVHKKLYKGDTDNLIPNIIDYAAGSGHFLTESMEEVQKYIDDFDSESVFGPVKSSLSAYKSDKFGWAMNHIYGIEKDYRLVKVSKVGCYFYGDGLASVIHGDGLDCFKQSKSYRGKLIEYDKSNPSENKSFDVVLANPPYSVSGFLGDLRRGKTNAEYNFEVYKYLTDQSSEIECLFIERTKQLLKDGGIAGIILPSSILSNTGIYTKTREIILKYFDIVGITELGSNTFMATGTNTVILFLKRRNNRNWQNIKSSVDKFVTDLKDITVNKVENIFSKYVKHVWKDISYDDYISIFNGNPSDLILKHEIYKECQKIKLAKNEKSIDKIIELEKDKLLYFILAYPQKIVLVKSGEKKAEKVFLGYEFSNRRGSEGIHPIQRRKSIDECTKLFDPQKLNNPTKASTYILDAFENNFERDVDEELKDHILRINLIDMMTWDSSSFEKNISLSVKKKIKIESKWELVKLGNNLLFKLKSKRPASFGEEIGKYPFYTSSKILNKFVENFDYKDENIIIGDGGDSSIFIDSKFSVSDHNFVFSSNNPKLLNKYIYNFYKINFNFIQFGLKGQGLKNISKAYLKDLEIPLPPRDIQEKIVKEIEELEKKENEFKNKFQKLTDEIKGSLENINSDPLNLSDLVKFKNGLNYDRSSQGEIVKIIGVKDFQEFFSPNLNELDEIEISGNLSEDYELKNNDLLVVRSNGSKRLVGRFLYINDLKEKTSFSGFTIRLRSNSENYNSKFLCYYLKSSKVRNELFNKSDGSNIKSLNQTLLGNLKIPKLKLDEQNKIIKKIEKIETEISKLEAQMKEIPELKEKVLKSYL